MNSDDFTVLVSWGGVCCYHMYCVSIMFKMTEQVEQQIYKKFCVKLEHSSTEASQITKKATAMGNW